ncbi:PEBP-like protein [Auriculariales sp. MPI-PUGE-AT-0066]|nr:PEBP-like protein [Auriculariales sp. MPI-PUGE-AT-0066]
MLASARKSARLAPSALARAGSSSLQQSGSASCSALRTFSQTTAPLNAATEPSPSNGSSSHPSGSESGSVSTGASRPTKGRHFLPYPRGFLTRRSKMNPSPLSGYPLPENIVASKGPDPEGRFALRQPITPNYVEAPRHHWIQWRDSWRLNNRRRNIWRNDKMHWRAKLRKEGKLPAYQQRLAGPGTNTPRVEHIMSRHRAGRLYIRGKDGRPQRMATKWLVFPDGRRARKVGWRRVNKGRVILASVKKVGRNDNWTRPFKEGRLKVYDLAMEYLKKDRDSLKNEIVELRKTSKKFEEGTPEWQKIRDKINIIEIQSEINDPVVRWDVKHGHYDFTNPAHRHLVEDKWRKQGRLDLLMERVYQMNVVPDLVPNFHPNIDLHVEFPMRAPYGKRLATELADKPPRFGDMEPGRYLLPNQTLSPPVVRARAFHMDQRNYTLVMVDPDVPDVHNETYQTFLHWAVPNIPLSIFSRSFRLSLHNMPQLSYIPPHPQQGTAYHRYTIFLLRQSRPVQLPPLESINRLGFNLREFIAQHRLMVPNMPSSPVEYPALPSNVHPGNPRWIGRADPNLLEGGIPGGIRPGGIAGLPGPMGGREARWGVPKGVRQNVGISGRSGGRGKEDEIGGGVFMWREIHDGEGGVVSNIYKDILKVPEPKYARPKRGDRLAEVKSVKKYNFVKY